jgi:hypothetical protein
MINIKYQLQIMKIILNPASSLHYPRHICVLHVWWWCTFMFIRFCPLYLILPADGLLKLKMCDGICHEIDNIYIFVHCMCIVWNCIWIILNNVHEQIKYICTRYVYQNIHLKLITAPHTPGTVKLIMDLDILCKYMSTIWISLDKELHCDRF